MSPRRAAAAPSEIPAAALPPASALLGGSPAASAGPLSPTDERRERQLEDILQAIGTDGRIAVYSDGKYAGTMPIEGFSLESLLDQYGGGDKTLVIYQGNVKRESVRVPLDPDIPATSPRQQRLEAERRKQGGATVGGGVPGVGDLTAVLTAMMTANMQTLQSSQQMMTGMVSAMTALMAARPQADPMDVAVKIAALVKDNASPAGSGVAANEVLGLLKEGIGMGKLLSGGNDEDGTLGVVKEGLGIVGKIVDAQAAQHGGLGSAPVPSVVSRRLGAGISQDGDNTNAVVSGGHAAGGGRDRGPGPGDPGAGAGISGSAAASAQSGSMSEASVRGTGPLRPWLRRAAPHVGMLATAARIMSPESVAETIERNLTDEEWADLLDDMYDETAPGFGGRLIAAVPSVGSVDPAWLQELLALLVTYDGGELDEASSAAEAPGSAPSGTPPT